jgi:hypothetical protein
MRKNFGTTASGLVAISSNLYFLRVVPSSNPVIIVAKHRQISEGGRKFPLIATVVTVPFYSSNLFTFLTTL